MRVAYLINQYPKVSHTFIRREIHALERLGVEVLRYSVRPGDDSADVDDHAEAQRTHVLLQHRASLLTGAVRTWLTRPWRSLRTLLRAISFGWRCSRGLIGWLAYFVEASSLRTQLQARGVLHLHAHFGTNPAAVAMLCRWLGGPKYSFTVHGPTEFDSPSDLLLREKCAHAQFVAAISHFARGQLLRWVADADAVKIHVVRCGLDASYFTAPTASPASSQATPQLLCIARLTPEKGHSLLLQAAQQLAAQGHRFTLVFAGDGPKRQALAEQASALGLGDRVTITGWLTNAEVRDALAQARCLVSASVAEGLPVVMMEALARGVPVVATHIAGVSELIEPGRSGWLVPSGDATALAAALAEMLTASAEQLRAFGLAGQARCRVQHSAADAAAQLRELFRANPAH